LPLQSITLAPAVDALAATSVIFPSLKTTVPLLIICPHWLMQWFVFVAVPAT
jgi:hypothetical protein